MFLPTRAVVVEYKPGRWGGKTGRFIGHYTALLDGKIERADFHDRLTKLEVFGAKASPPGWIPRVHLLLDLLVGIMGCALLATDSEDRVKVVLPVVLIVLTASVALRLCYLKKRLEEFRRETSSLCASFTALDSRQDGQGLAWEIHGSPRWAWAYTFPASWFTGEDRVPFRIDVLLRTRADPMMKIDVETTIQTDQVDVVGFDSRQEKLQTCATPSTLVPVDDLRPAEPNVIHTVIPLPSPPPTDASPVHPKALLPRSLSLISKTGHRRNSSGKSCKTIPSTSRRHHRLLPKTPQRVSSGHDGYFSGALHGSSHGAESFFSASSKASNSRVSSSSTSSNHHDGKPFMIVPMPTPPPEWPVSPEPPQMQSFAAEVIAPVFPADCAEDRHGTSFV